MTTKHTSRYPRHDLAFLSLPTLRGGGSKSTPRPQRSSLPSLRGVQRRSNPAFLARPGWIAASRSLLAMTTSDSRPTPPHSRDERGRCSFLSLPREAWGGWLAEREAISETGGGCFSKLSVYALACATPTRHSFAPLTMCHPPHKGGGIRKSVARLNAHSPTPPRSRRMICASLL